MIENTVEVQAIEARLAKMAAELREYHNTIDDLQDQLGDYEHLAGVLEEEMDELELELEELIGTPRYFVYDTSTKSPVAGGFFREFDARQRLKELDEPALTVITVWNK